MDKRWGSPGLRLALTMGATALVTSLAAMVLGLLIGVAGLWAGLLLAAGLLLWAMLLLPWRWMLVLLMVMVFLLAGPLQYAAGLGKAHWMPYLMACVMAVRLLLEGAMFRATGSGNLSAIGPITPAVNTPLKWVKWAMAALGLWAISLVTASIVHRVPPLQWLVGGKDLFLLWAVPAAFATGWLALPMLQRLCKPVVLWLWLQVPVVMWQRFVVAPRRGGDSPWDAVVGLFAGQAWGGGGSGTMAIVSLWAAALVTMAWRAGAVTGAWAGAGVLAALLACAMAEVKVALLVVPLLAALAAWPVPADALRSSKVGQGARALAIIIGGLVFSGSLLAIHQLQFTSIRSQEGRSLERYLDTMVDRNLDDSVMADAHGELTRAGALRWWWKRQSIGDVPGWLIGHGIGSSRRTQTSVGEMARVERVGLDRSTASVMLWESGLLGLVSWATGMTALAMAAWQLRRQEPVRPWSWLLQAAAAILLLSVLTLPYGADLVSAPHLPMALMLGVGIVLAAQRLVSRSQDACT